ncbi:MAG TPA: tripartite tricarboxylate transporter substrate-binding protein [Xanthobacteraceae bacterium]|nr:tripartite tricarboxylate transporter substrate-binding protein [Xanthobacteraceae bacterium]
MAISTWLSGTVAMLAFALGATAPAAAQDAADFPASTVRVLVPFAAGGPTDVVARILAELLAERWGGRSVVVEDRPGAGTIVATTAIAKAPPDGYTIGIATNSLLINPAIGLTLPYDTRKDFVPISMIATQPVALVANAAFPANTLADVIAVAKRSAEPLNYTSPGPRGVGHLAGEMLKQRAGIAMQHINYNGSAPALNDVIAGRVPLMFDIWHSARRYVETGQLKLIAGAGLAPLPGAESAPLIAQTFPGFNVVAFNAVIGPAGIPPPVLEKLSTYIGAVVDSPEFAERTRPLGIDAKSMSPHALDAWFAKEMDKWAAIAQEAHLKAE